MNAKVQEFSPDSSQRGTPLGDTSAPRLPLLGCLEPAGWRRVEVWGSRLGTPPSYLVCISEGGVISSWPLNLTPDLNPTSALSSDSHSLGPPPTTCSWSRPDLQSLGPVPNFPQPPHHHHHLLQPEFPACPECGLASQPSAALGPPSCLLQIPRNPSPPKAQGGGGSSRPSSQEGPRKLDRAPLLHRPARLP